MFYIDRLQPDLVIVDMHMKKGAAIELLRYAKALHNPARVIMMTDRDDSEELMATVQLQAEGYLSKLIEVQELLSQIKRVCNGKVVVSNRLNYVSFQHRNFCQSFDGGLDSCIQG